MSKLIRFPDARGRSEIPRPVNYQPGDVCLRVDLMDDALAHMGFHPGVCFTVLKGALWDRLPHAVEFDGETYLGVVTLLDAATVEFASWHQGEHSGRYRLKDLNILGAICEAFPLGDSGPRWSLSGNPKTNSERHTHASLLKATV